MRQKRDFSAPRGARIAVGAAVGAIVAIVVGYGLSAVLSRFGLALVAPTQAAQSTSGAFVARTLLNFFAVHHIRIAGGGLPGGPTHTAVSILWPIAIWAALPAVGLMLGGRVSARLCRADTSGRFAAGAWIAPTYVIVLLIARPFVAVPSVAIKLPEIAGMGIAPESVPALLSPSVAGTLVYGLIFAITFGGIGAIGGVGAIRRGLVRKDGFWPAWARGAASALIIGQLAFLILGIVGAIAVVSRQHGDSQSRPGETVKSWITVSPAVSGAVYYMAHGVTMRGEIARRIGLPEAKPEVQIVRAGLITGTEFEGKKKPLPVWMFAIVLFPALALIYGGFVAAKTSSGPMSRSWLAARLAGAYALLMTALSPIYTLAVRTEIAAGDMNTSTSAFIGPSAAQTFALGLVLAFIFSLIGARLYRPNART